MSPQTVPRRANRHAETDAVRDTDDDELLAVLDDEDCRAVLAATSEESLTAKEITERCGIPSSTVYRKLDRLTDAGLLCEELRLRRSGKHTREYRRCVDQVVVSLDESGCRLDPASAGGS